MDCLLGDSIARGVVFDDRKGRYIFSKVSFSKILEANGTHTFKNLSKFGATIRSGLSVLSKQSSDIVICKRVFVEFGGNDCNFRWEEVADNPMASHSPLTPLNTFISLYQELIKQLLQLDIDLVLINLPPLEPYRFFKWVTQDLQQDNVLKFLSGDVESIQKWHNSYSQAVDSLAKNNGLPLLDINRAFLNQKDWQDSICTDGIHPNERGHNLIARVLSDFDSTNPPTSY